jgi:hypothetical protein
MVSVFTLAPWMLKQNYDLLLVAVGSYMEAVAGIFMANFANVNTVDFAKLFTLAG